MDDGSWLTHIRHQNSDIDKCARMNGKTDAESQRGFFKYLAAIQSGEKPCLKDEDLLFYQMLAAYPSPIDVNSKLEELKDEGIADGSTADNTRNNTGVSLMSGDGGELVAEGKTEEGTLPGGMEAANLDSTNAEPSTNTAAESQPFEGTEQPQPSQFTTAEDVLAPSNDPNVSVDLNAIDESDLFDFNEEIPPLTAQELIESEPLFVFEG